MRLRWHRDRPAEPPSGPRARSAVPLGRAVGVGAVGVLAVGVVAALSGDGGAGTTGARSFATTLSSGVEVGADDPAALALLHRATVAVRSAAYAGRQYATVWGLSGADTVVADVSHVPGRGSVVTVHGMTGTVKGELDDADDATLPSGDPALLSGLGSDALGMLERSYLLRVPRPGGAVDAVAGRPADVVEAYRPATGDGPAALAARFWVDRATGLLLGRELLDRSGRTVGSTAFVQVRIGTPAAPVPPSRTGATASPSPAATAGAPPTSGSRLSDADVTTLRASGRWTAPPKLASSMIMYDARRTGPPGRGRVLQLSYSDGLSTVSLFEQHGRLPAAGPADLRPARMAGRTVYVGDGVPARVAWECAGIVYTVVADAPQETVEGVVAALPHPATAAGPLGRLRRGLGRVGSWLDPLG